MKKTFEAYGREIVLEVEERIDEYGQFLVRLTLDGKEVHAVHYTDRSVEEAEAGGDPAPREVEAAEIPGQTTIPLGGLDVGAG